MFLFPVRNELHAAAVESLPSSQAVVAQHCGSECQAPLVLDFSALWWTAGLALCCHLLPQLLPPLLLNQPAVSSLYQLTQLVLSRSELLQTLLVAEIP